MADSVPLITVLEENGFGVEVMSPAEMPTELVALQRSDVLILNNVSADSLSVEQLQHIENYVHDLGHGLVVIGGRHAYGPGGYTDSALERVLPVEMTPRERKDAVAIVFVLDTSGSMANYVGARQKIQLAIEGVRTGIRNLDEEDVAGILGFNTDVHHISDLTSDHSALISAVSKLRPTGGTTKIKDATEDAYELLKANAAKRKHIVLLSDGKSDGAESAFLELAAQIAEARISITTIAIGDANRQLLSRVAETGGGRAVFVQNLQQLPTVLTEAVRETRRYIVQEPFSTRYCYSPANRLCQASAHYRSFTATSQHRRRRWLRYSSIRIKTNRFLRVGISDWGNRSRGHRTFNRHGQRRGFRGTTSENSGDRSLTGRFL